MYLTLNQVILVSNQAKRQPEDAVVYFRDSAQSGKLLFPDFGLTQDDIAKHELTRYGTIYTDKTHQENWCVVPDVWNEDDAMCAKMWM